MQQLRKTRSAMLRWPFLAMALLCLSSIALLPARGAAQASPPPADASSQTQPTYKVQAKSNVVLVRVVVRDANGKPIDGLTQNDFQVFDNGKPQTIAQFAVEHPAGAAEKAVPAAPATEKSAPPSETKPAFTAPQRFVALYFDDARTSFEDLARVREAALGFLSSGIRPEDRLAIFTTSGFVSQDYTSDRAKLEAAIGQLQYRPNAGEPRDDCPKLSDYQADLIVNHQDADAMAVAVNEGMQRGCLAHPQMPSGGVASSVFNGDQGTQNLVFGRARQVFDYYDLQAHTSLYTLKEMIRRVALLPGQREIVLVTPGFMPLNFTSMLEEAVDLALRSNVMIGALDPRGVFTNLHMTDAGDQQYLGNPRLETSVRLLHEQSSVWAAWAVPEELAMATGGEAVHNTNDLVGGLASVSAPPSVYYTLAFAPTELEANGKFHALKVKLSNERGLSVDARKGYFAPRQVLTAEQQIDAQIKDAAYSSGETMELPVQLKTQFFKTKEGKAQLTLLARVDARGLDFVKEGATDKNHLRFVAVVFDVNGNYVAGQQKDLDVTVPNENLTELRSQGLTMRTEFTLAPGPYTVRQVVRDSAGGHISALTRNVEVPD